MLAEWVSSCKKTLLGRDLTPNQGAAQEKQQEGQLTTQVRDNNSGNLRVPTKDKLQCQTLALLDCRPSKESHIPLGINYSGPIYFKCYSAL